MRILQVAPLEESVPPRKYGGVELVVHNLVETQVSLGHEVYLLASGDSQTSANLIPIIPQSIRAAYSPQDFDAHRNYLKYYYTATVLKTINQFKPDIVHNHFAWRLIAYRDLINIPMYSTMHGPLNSLPEIFTYRHHQDANFISISDNQRQAMPELNWLDTVYNGIDTNHFTVGDKKSRDYFAFLGRTSPEKGLKEICQMIRTTKHRLKIAAKVDPYDEAYFNRQIRPLIDGRQIEFIGEIGPQQKNEFLKKAKALLLWLNWEEPFGLVVVEAMAAGTPVIVNPRGSMSELVVDNQTGFLVSSIDHMRLQLDLVPQLDPHNCRHRVETHFSAKVMTQQYIELAAKLIDSKITA
jgi:glycosyltransferase involved in cell wall biosynthesis